MLRKSDKSDVLRLSSRLMDSILSKRKLWTVSFGLVVAIGTLGWACWRIPADVPSQNTDRFLIQNKTTPDTVPLLDLIKHEMQSGQFPSKGWMANRTLSDIVLGRRVDPVEVRRAVEPFDGLVVRVLQLSEAASLEHTGFVIPDDLISEYILVERLIHASALEDLYSNRSLLGTKKGVAMVLIGFSVMNGAATRGRWRLGRSTCMHGLAVCELGLRMGAVTSEMFSNVASCLDHMIDESQELGLASMAKREYWHFDKLVSDVKSGHVSHDRMPYEVRQMTSLSDRWHRFEFRPNFIRNIIAVWEDEVIARSKMRSLSEESTILDFASFEHRTGNWSLSYFEEWIIDRLTAYQCQRPRDLHLEKCEMEAWIRGIRLMIAMRQYEVINQRLPFSIDELEIPHIALVSTDPYSGEPFGFYREFRILSASGSDCRRSTAISRTSTSRPRLRLDGTFPEENDINFNLFLGNEK